MNIVSPVVPMLQDEHVLAIDPLPVADGISSVRRRFNAFQGRSLSADDLSGLQMSRMASQSLLHRSVSSGIVNGLEVELPAANSLLVRPGFGLSLQGEDIFVGVSRQFDLADIPVLVPKADETPPALERFDSLKANADAIKFHAAVLVAVPISFVSNEAPRPSTDKFVPHDPVDDPFAGLLETDGCLFALAPLAFRNAPDPSQSFDPAKPSHQNELAHAIFQEEGRFSSSDCHLWERAGLPLALIGFTADWRISFVDRSSVVRPGGQKKALQLVKGGVAPLLRSARVEQFGEQLGGLSALPEKMSSLRDVFRWLPPVGFMPKRLAGFGLTDSIFPEDFNVKAVPVPDDQVALLIQQSIGLDTIDFTQREDVELAYPVPASDYDPRLFMTDEIDASFDAAVSELSATRNRAIAHIDWVEAVQRKLQSVKTGQSITPASADGPPDAEEMAGLFSLRRISRFTPVGSYTLRIDDLRFVAEAGDKLYIWLKVESDAKALVIFTDGSLTFEEDVGRDNYVQISFTEAAQPGITFVSSGTSDGWMYVEVDVTTLVLNKVASAEELQKHQPAYVINYAAFTAENGQVLLAEFGLKKSSGDSVPVITDTLPGVGHYKPPQGAQESDWNWLGDPIDWGGDSFGTSRAGSQLKMPAVDAFTAKVAHLDFLGPEAARLATLPVDQIVDTLTAQISATNDAIDLGFLTARANTFRVREFMLGSDEASRLLTSPALADVIKQDTSARVTAEQLKSFLVKNKFTPTGEG